jgi:uncharacterized protein YggE
MKRNVSVALAAVLALAAWASAESLNIDIPEAFFKGYAEKEQPLILTVTGKGEVKAVPDQVIVTANIYTQDKKAGKAFDDNQFKMQMLLDGLKPLGIPREKIATSALSISPVYKKDSYNVDYFAVSRTVVIAQEDMGKISPVLDALVDAGIGDIGNIQFVVKELDEKYDEALEEAAADARKVGDMLASAMGAHVVGLKDIRYDYGGGDYDYRRGDVSGRFAEEANMNQTIVPREVTTTVYVYATYELKYGP